MKPTLTNFFLLFLLISFTYIKIQARTAESFFEIARKKYNLETILNTKRLPPPPNTWNNLGQGLNQIVKCIYIDGTDIYAGGTFTDAGGNANADYIAKFNGTSWESLGNQVLPICSVNAICKLGTNIYIGGNFIDGFGNVNIDRIARWDGTSWNPLATGLSSDVYALDTMGNNVLVGGKFLNAGGVANADYIASWNGTAFQQVGTGTSNVLSKAVRDIKVEGTTIYVCGEFLNAGGNAAADYVSKMPNTSWLPVCGTSLTSVVPNIVYTLDYQNGIVYVGGTFTDGGGIPTADYIAKTDGNTWSDVGGGDVNGVVYALNADGNDNLYVSGDFYNLGGNSNNLFASCLVANTWQPLSTGLNGFSYSIEMTPDYLNIYFGGTFDNAGGNSNANFIAKWEASLLPVDYLYFVASETKNGNFLKWKVTAESNSNNHIVEHSTDGIHFEDIGNKYPNNTGGELEYLHKNPSNGANFYRIKTIDFNGEIYFSSIIKLDNYNFQIGLKSNIITNNIIEFIGSDFSGMIIDVINTKGKKVFSKKITASTIIIPEFEKGNYIVNVINSRNSNSYKVIIQ